MDNTFDQYSEISEILKVLAHPVRLCIVKGLIDNGESNVSHIQTCLDVPQSTVSQHLQKLKAARILEGTRNGIEINYRVCDELVIKLVKALFS
jgi:DNA-binding transcriptional ArsR family regulator